MENRLRHKILWQSGGGQGTAPNREVFGSYSDVCGFPRNVKINRNLASEGWGHFLNITNAFVYIICHVN